MMELISFTRGVPPEESFPNAALIDCAQRVISKNSAQVLQYGNGGGYGPLREYIANQNAVNVNQVVIGQGSLQLLDLLCRVTIKDGDPVFIEQPTYDRTLTLFKRAGANLIGFRLKDGQVDIADVERQLKKGIVPKYFYVIPDFQNPNGTVMSMETRSALAHLASKYGFLIIEDCPYRHLRYEGRDVPLLHELSPDRVILMSSFSKVISPGLRTGYMVLPAMIAEDLIKYASDTYISPSFFNQALVIDFIKQGLLKAHREYLIGLFHPRLKVMLKELKKNFSGVGDWSKPKGGYFVGLTLNPEIAPLDVEKAPDFGLALTDGRGFFLNGGERFLRLPFCALDETQIKEGLRRLASMIA
ncbi:MAG: PLP-dependent aminotransferase family protein [Anaerolineaceae bacterium]|nr:PLP-dependent aminotransferase family protein [Anaerolineaceae bacterium]